MNSLGCLFWIKAFVLHPDKRPHELSDQFVKERCLMFRLKRGAYFTVRRVDVNRLFASFSKVFEDLPVIRPAEMIR